jgi:hypothetical protein
MHSFLPAPLSITALNGLGILTEYLNYGADLGAGETLGVIQGYAGYGIPDIVTEAFAAECFEIARCYFLFADMFFIPVRLDEEQRALIKVSMINGLSFGDDPMPSADAYKGSEPLTVTNVPRLPQLLIERLQQSCSERTRAANHQLSSEIMHRVGRNEG